MSCEDSSCQDNSDCGGLICCGDGVCHVSCGSGSCDDDGDCGNCQTCVGGECIDAPVEITIPEEDGEDFVTDWNITFEANSSDVEWSCSGNPSSGTGSSFTTKFSTIGRKTVTASSDNCNDSIKVDIFDEGHSFTGEFDVYGSWGDETALKVYNSIMAMGYTADIKVKATESQIKEEIPRHTLFYISSHGVAWDSTVGFTGYDGNYVWNNDVSQLMDDSNVQYRLVHINTCHSGDNSAMYSAFSPLVYVGWEGVPTEEGAYYYAGYFWDYLEDGWNVVDANFQAIMDVPLGYLYNAQSKIYGNSTIVIKK